MKRSHSAPPALTIGGETPDAPDAASERSGHRVLIPTHGAAPSRPPGDQIVALDGHALGGDWSARVVAPAEWDAEALRALVQAELDAGTELFSRRAPHSEISRFNAAPAGFWALSAPFWALLDAAMDLGDETNGAFDPTLGALIDLWGFGKDGGRDGGRDGELGGDGASPPSEDEIEAALAVSGWRRLRFNRDARAALQPGGLVLDLGGVARGWALDRASARLIQAGATSHLIEAGGRLKGVGVKPDAQPWWVEITPPEGAPGPRTVAALQGMSVATWNDGAAWVHDGRLYPDRLDGRTGRPIRTRVASVTVLHASAMKAEAYGAALAVMGVQEGLAFAEATGLAAHLTWRGSDGPGGPLGEAWSPAFAAMMDEGAT